MDGRYDVDIQILFSLCENVFFCANPGCRHLENSNTFIKFSMAFYSSDKRWKGLLLIFLFLLLELSVLKQPDFYSGDTAGTMKHV